MKLCSFLSLILAEVCLGSVSSVPIRHVKRGGETNATLYAYGTNSSGWPIAYGLSDGLLYVTETPNNSSANLTSVTWDLATIIDHNWVANATLMNGTSAGSLYIEPNENNAVGVLPISKVPSVNGTISGFALFNTQLVYDNNTELEAQFWATETDSTGIYLLSWVSDQSSVASDSFPVVVKASKNA